MERSGYTDDYYDSPASGMWLRRLKQVLRSNRTRRTLLEMRAAIEAEPELIRGAMIDGCAVCALGALYVSRKQQAGLSRSEALDELRDIQRANTYRFENLFGAEESLDSEGALSDTISEMDVNDMLARECAFELDESGGSPKQAALKWIDSVLAGTNPRFSETIGEW